MSAGSGTAGGDWKCECRQAHGVHRSCCSGCGSHSKEVDRLHTTPTRGTVGRRRAGTSGSKNHRGFRKTHKAIGAPEAVDNQGGTGKDRATGLAVLEAIKQLVDALSEDEEHKDAAMARQRVVTKKREAEPAQVKHDKVKRLGYLWKNMDKSPKEEEE